MNTNQSTEAKRLLKSGLTTKEVARKMRIKPTSVAAVLANMNRSHGHASKKINSTKRSNAVVNNATRAIANPVSAKSILAQINTLKSANRSAYNVLVRTVKSFKA